jgi:hypothetical protein
LRRLVSVGNIDAKFGNGTRRAKTALRSIPRIGARHDLVDCVM